MVHASLYLTFIFYTILLFIYTYIFLDFLLFTRKVIGTKLGVLRANLSNLHRFSISQKSNLFITQAIFQAIYWIKIRTSYFTKSWIYTTNHKRIAINYFSFIFVSGTAGMGLASVIRLEFAYPGVGILAGDSLQYLSIATAHGVIMVFFMIIPTLAGAFGNFLLPTQLGVHDVAFPRLNSAAFWFLPGGLIMLAQLVCIDRRYQRMNCFNIRELQSLLKKRFFADLVNSSDHREILSNSIINLRHKSNLNNLTDSDMSLFFNFGTTHTPKSKNLTLSNEYILSFFSTNYLANILLIFKSYLSTFILNPSTLTYNFQTYFSLSFYSLTWLPNLILNLRVILLGSLVQLPQLFNVFFTANIPSLGGISSIRAQDTYSGGSVNTNTEYSSSQLHADTWNISNSPLELTTAYRFSRFSNPLINYSYKSGHYIGIWDKLFPSLVTSFIEVTKNVIKASWIFSPSYISLLQENYATFNSNFNIRGALKNTSIDSWYTGNIQPMHNYFNLFSLNLVDAYKPNNRWVSTSHLNQKFIKMFSSASTQQRVLANWRQLRFTREAWRCKLLAARHQNTLYKRFLGEEGLVWSIDRNAKDLLPGWTMITPFSARTRYTAVGKTDIGLMGVLLVLNGSIVSAANFLVTYRYLSTLNNRKMRDARSFFSESLIVASWMAIAANPMLVIAIIMLLFDRHWQTSFFDYSGGGDTVLFQHMFWFFGHPEVYIILIPVFGFTNTIMSYYLRKRVSARSSLMYSMYTIAFLGFFVWGHHMYMVGLAHTTRMLFSTLTVMISVPAATKLMHWSVTIVNSFFTMEIPFLWTLCFMYFFISGGVSGMCVAHTGMDVLFHDTFYVVGHFHIMLAGSGMMGIFAAFYFYFPAMYGVRYSRLYAYIHFIYYIIGEFMTFVPMLWLGYCGMPRRVLDYPSSLGSWHAITSAGHLLVVFGMLAFFLMIYDSIRQAKPNVRNTFGIGRFNTRLNFYLFEVNRLNFLQRKNLYIFRSLQKSPKTTTPNNPLELGLVETSAFSYEFYKS